VNILLVRPDLIDSPDSLWGLGLRHVPLGLLYLGTALDRAGHRVLFSDEIAGDNALDDVARLSVDMVGITISSPLEARAARIARRAKAAGATVVIGGPHATIYPERSLRETGADLAVLGEGERSIVELASGAAPETVPGVAFLRDGALVVTPPREVLAELDTIPLPDRSLLDLSKYARDTEYGLETAPGGRLMRVMSSRGCASHCSFCARHRIFSRSPRYRSAENVVEEIREGVQRHGVNSVVFMDDTFTQEPAHAEAVSRAILDARLPIQWAAITRVGMPKDLLRLMHRAGCRLVELGVESGSPRILEGIKKGITVEEVVRTFRESREVGLKTKAFFMVGLPGETRRDFELSVALAQRLNPDFLCLQIFLPLPGSEIYDRLHPDEAAYLDRTFVRTPNRRHERLFHEFLLRFYLRPRYAPVVARNFRAYFDVAGRVPGLSRFGPPALSFSGPRRGRGPAGRLLRGRGR
jgi:anaerobic magnesium-protoporphyrin IX monomethyl ester cyclase